MGVTIEVYRGTGDRPGDEISDALIGDSIEAALARGRAELDASAHRFQITTIELVRPRFDLRLGDLIAVSSAAQTAILRGKVVGVRHAPKGGEAPTTLTVEHPLDV